MSCRVGGDYGDYSSWLNTYGHEIDYEKDPDEILDIALNLSAFLGADSIASYLITLPDGLTQVSVSTVDGRPTIFLSGGAVGGVYRVVYTVTTTGGRIYKKVLRVRVVEY